MNGTKRIAKYKGELDLAGFKLKCYVLEDGTRVLSTRGMQIALKMTDENDSQTSGSRLGENLRQKSLEPFVREFKEAGDFEPIICYDEEDGFKIHGYKATLLTSVCRIYLKARRSIHLSPRQRIIADQAEILIDSFADLGITALIDEATGYQYERERNALQKRWQKVLGLYVLDEPQEWKKMFPQTYYGQISRVWNWKPSSSKSVKRPSFIGKLTNDLIYDNLPEGVLEKLKKETPWTERGNRKHRFHQLLTTEVGREDLRKTINAIETLLSISGDKEEFKKLEAKYRLQKKSLYANLNLGVKNDTKLIKGLDPDKLLDACINTPPITLKQLKEELKKEKEEKKRNSEKKKDSE